MTLKELIDKAIDLKGSIAMDQIELKFIVVENGVEKMLDVKHIEIHSNPLGWNVLAMRS